jgi:hypothetical protein
LASITDPSGHVFVVCGVDGDGINVCMHDGSLGFFVQPTVDGVVVPEVQLPATHVVPSPFPPPPDAVTDVLFGCIAVDVLLDGGLNIIDDMLDVFVRFVDVALVALLGVVVFAMLVALGLGITVSQLQQRIYHYL